MQQSTILKCQTKYILEQISCLATSYFKVLSFSAYIKHAPVHNTGLVMVRERDGERGTSRERGMGRGRHLERERWRFHTCVLKMSSFSFLLKILLNLSVVMNLYNI